MEPVLVALTPLAQSKESPAPGRVFLLRGRYGSASPMRA
ncbi:Uncharacterised protein [Bordetella pertussis]|nr:Uncharacterised protein [Bordetella pertussis]